jgi:hypothetical protein
MGPIEMRPLGVGEILDVAINICVRHAGTLLRLVLLIVLPVQALSTLVTLSLEDEVTGPLEEGGDGTPTVDGEFWLGLAGFGVVMLLTVLAGAFATAACFRAVSEAYLGRDPSWRESLRFAGRRLHSVLWVVVLSAIGVVLGAFLLLVGAVAFYVFWSVAVPVVLAEDRRGRKALARSWRLVRGRWWPAFGVLVVGALLGAILGYGVAALLELLPTESGSVGDTLLAGLGQFVAAAVTTPLTAAFTVVLYFDLRVRKEGYDLQLLAERLASVDDAAGPARLGTTSAPPTRAGASRADPLREDRDGADDPDRPLW